MRGWGAPSPGGLLVWWGVWGVPVVVGCVVVVGAGSVSSCLVCLFVVCGAGWLVGWVVGVGGVGMPRGAPRLIGTGPGLCSNPLGLMRRGGPVVCGGVCVVAGGCPLCGGVCGGGGVPVPVWWLGWLWCAPVDLWRAGVRMVMGGGVGCPPRFKRGSCCPAS